MTLLKKITNEELKKVLEQDKLWKDTNGAQGKLADLSYTNLYGANLYGANLYRANLKGANLYGANLENANLEWADLEGACLYRANLENANLGYANLCRADLEGANLYRAYLAQANLEWAYLGGANLEGANLEGANLCRADLVAADLEGACLYRVCLHNTKLDKKEQIRKGISLEKSIKGYKKSARGEIIELLIPAGATVFSINNRKCRTNKAKVIAINSDTTKGIQAKSYRDSSFIYEVGKTLTIKDFNLQYNIECASGIHFFRTKEEALSYELC